MSSIMLGDTPAKLYLGDYLLTGDTAGYTIEDICGMVCDARWGAGYTLCMVMLDKSTSTATAEYFGINGAADWALSLRYDSFSDDFKTLSTRLCFGADYYSTYTSKEYNNNENVKNVIPNATQSGTYSYYFDAGAQRKFMIRNISALAACHPAISARYTLAEGSWNNYTSDEWGFKDLITLDGADATDYLLGVTFANGRRIYRYTSEPVFVFDGTEYRTQGNPDVIRYQPDFVLAQTAKNKIVVTADTSTFTFMASEINFSTFNMYDTDGDLIFARNADISDFVAST